MVAKSSYSLDVVDVATPCHADWNEMQGSDQVRFCASCGLNVYNLSEMNRDAAQRLVEEREGRLCVRFYSRSDGTMITRDCPIGLRAMRACVRRWLAGVAAVVALANVMAAAFATGARGTLAPTKNRSSAAPVAPGKAGVDVRMGDFAPPRPPKPQPAPPDILMMGKVAMPPKAEPAPPKCTQPTGAPTSSASDPKVLMGKPKTAPIDSRIKMGEMPPKKPAPTPPTETHR